MTVVSVICSPAQGRPRPAGAVVRLCCACAQEVFLRFESALEAEKAEHRVICGPCAQDEITKTTGGNAIVVRGKTRAEVQSLIERVGVDKLMEMTGEAARDGVLNVILSEDDTPDSGEPPPSYRGPKPGQTLVHDGVSYMCLEVTRNPDHDCALGDLCGGAWNAHLIPEDQFER